MNKDTSDKIDKLIRRGIVITHQAHEYEIRQKKDPIESMLNMVVKYHQWKLDVANLLLASGCEKEKYPFIEGDSVPMVWGGKEYRSIESPASKELLNNILNETKNKLIILRELGSKTADEKEAPKTKTALRYSQEKGFYNNTKKGNYKPLNGGAPKRIIELLLQQSYAVPGPELLKLIKKVFPSYDSSNLSHAIDRINNNTKKNLQLENDIIINKGSGYALNRSAYKIEKK